MEGIRLFPTMSSVIRLREKVINYDKNKEDLSGT